MHEYIYSVVSLVAFIFDLLHSPFAWINYTFYLLGGPFSCDCGANVHPLSSLVNSQLFTPCCLTHPEDAHGSSYSLHRRHHNISYSVWYKTNVFLYFDCTVPTKKKTHRLTQEIQKLTIKNTGELLTSKAKTRNITAQCTCKIEGAFPGLFKWPKWAWHKSRVTVPLIMAVFTNFWNFIHSACILLSLSKRGQCIKCDKQ
jgi:hypothetical protein